MILWKTHFLSGHLTEWRCLWHTNLVCSGYGYGITGDCRPVGREVDVEAESESVPIKLVLDARHEMIIIMIIMIVFVVAIFEVALRTI